MAERELPTPEELRQLLRYEPETGKLYWLRRTRGIDPNDRRRRAFNAQFAGKEAFTAKQHGYRIGTIFGHPARAHRVIWTLVHGEWPPHHIDHINGQRDDNRLCNLRCATHAQNARNKARRVDNSSGRTGVRLEKRTGRWEARIRVDGCHIHLGTFKRFEDAVAAREASEIEHDFHPNHDRLW